MPPTNLETLRLSSGDPPPRIIGHRPEPIHIPIAEISWLKPSRALDRGESTIGSANPKSIRSSSKTKPPFPKLQPVNPNRPIIVLPVQIQQSVFVVGGPRHLRTLRIHPFRTKLNKSADPEPRSPNISCFGGVFLRKERKICVTREIEIEIEIEIEEGCWARFAAIFTNTGKRQAVLRDLEDEIGCSSSSESDPTVAPAAPAKVQVPELQEMKRFTSSRRHDSWADGVILEGSLQPLDRERSLGVRP